MQEHKRAVLVRGEVIAATRRHHIHPAALIPTETDMFQVQVWATLHHRRRACSIQHQVSIVCLRFSHHRHHHYYQSNEIEWRRNELCTIWETMSSMVITIGNKWGKNLIWWIYKVGVRAWHPCPQLHYPASRRSLDRFIWYDTVEMLINILRYFDDVLSRLLFTVVIVTAVNWATQSLSHCVALHLISFTIKLVTKVTLWALYNTIGH